MAKLEASTPPVPSKEAVEKLADGEAAVKVDVPDDMVLGGPPGFDVVV